MPEMDAVRLSRKDNRSPELQRFSALMDYDASWPRSRKSTKGGCTWTNPSNLFVSRNVYSSWEYEMGWFLVEILCFMTGHWIFGILFLIISWS